MRIFGWCLLTLVLAGCVKVNPRIDPDIDAKIQAGLNTNVDFKELVKFKDNNIKLAEEVGTLTNTVNTDIESLAKVESKINMTIGEMTGIKAAVESLVKLESNISTNADKLVGMETKFDSLAKIETNVDTAANKLKADISAKFRDLKSEVRQQIGTFKGQQNVGAFSGGAVYVTVITVVLIIAMAVIIYLRGRRADKWRKIFEAFSLVVQEEENNGNAEAVKNIKARLAKKAEQRGLMQLITNSLVDRGMS